MRLWKLFGGPPIKVIKVDGEKQSWKYQYTEKVESFSAGFCLKIHWADKNVDKRKYIFNMLSSLLPFQIDFPVPETTRTNKTPYVKRKQ